MWSSAGAKHTYLALFILAPCGVAGFVTPGLVSAQAGGARTGAAPPFPAPPASSPARSLAYSCGVPPVPLETRATPQQALFPARQDTVSLTAASPLGARNELAH